MFLSEMTYESCLSECATKESKPEHSSLQRLLWRDRSRIKIEMSLYRLGNDDCNYCGL